MTLTPIQQVLLLVLLGPEKLGAWDYWRRRDQVLQRAVTWQKVNREKRNARERRRRESNGKKFRDYFSQWRDENREKLRAYFRDYSREQLQSNEGYRIAKASRLRIYSALRGKVKSARTAELLGCTVPELRAHLEVQFTPGMTWENYGSWHVDHKRPCASFDLSDPAQQRECFHFTNLQPLWALDNIRKGAKYA